MYGLPKRLGYEVITADGMGKAQGYGNRMVKVALNGGMQKAFHPKDIVQVDRAIFTMEKGLTEWDHLNTQEQLSLVRGIESAPQHLSGIAGRQWKSLDGETRSFLLTILKGKMDKADGTKDITRWITVRGAHVPIKSGQSEREAITGFLKDKVEDGGNLQANEYKDNKKKNKDAFLGKTEKKKKLKEIAEQDRVKRGNMRMREFEAEQRASKTTGKDKKHEGETVMKRLKQDYANTINDYKERDIDSKLDKIRSSIKDAEKQYGISAGDYSKGRQDSKYSKERVKMDHDVGEADRKVSNKPLIRKSVVHPDSLPKNSSSGKDSDPILESTYKNDRAKLVKDGYNEDELKVFDKNHEFDRAMSPIIEKYQDGMKSADSGKTEELGRMYNEGHNAAVKKVWGEGGAGEWQKANLKNANLKKHGIRRKNDKIRSVGKTTGKDKINKLDSKYNKKTGNGSKGMSEREYANRSSKLSAKLHKDQDGVHESMARGNIGDKFRKDMNELKKKYKKSGDTHTPMKIRKKDTEYERTSDKKKANKSKMNKALPLLNVIDKYSKFGGTDNKALVDSSDYKQNIEFLSQNVKCAGGSPITSEQKKKDDAACTKNVNEALKSDKILETGIQSRITPLDAEAKYWNIFVDKYDPAKKEQRQMDLFAEKYPLEGGMNKALDPYGVLDESDGTHTISLMLNPLNQIVQARSMAKSMLKATYDNNNVLVKAMIEPIVI